MKHPKLMLKEELNKLFLKIFTPKLDEGMAISTFNHFMAYSQEEKANFVCAYFSIPEDPNEEGIASMQFYTALAIAKNNEETCCEFC